MRSRQSRIVILRGNKPDEYEVGDSALTIYNKKWVSIMDTPEMFTYNQIVKIDYSFSFWGYFLNYRHIKIQTTEGVFYLKYVKNYLEFFNLLKKKINEQANKSI